MPRLGYHRYGKSRVRFLKVVRDGARHSVVDLDVDVALVGRFAETHVHGDNRDVLPTDTMKNTVYALGHGHTFGSAEGFALALGRHFVENHPRVDVAEIRIASGAWRRIRTAGGPHDHAFLRSKREVRSCLARVGRDGARLHAAIRNLELMKTTRSAFRDFHRDAFTTLEDASDRLLATTVTARWEYASVPGDCDDAWTRVREALVGAFAEHDSLSVQQTAYAMACAALDACAEVARIRLVLPNRHCLWVDLAPFGIRNENEVFRPAGEPHGRIEAVVER